MSEAPSHPLAVPLAGEAVALHPERALSWPAGRALFIADPHWGKADAFRAAGVPVPGAGTTADLARLLALLDATRPERLVILGDLFHAKAGRSPELLEAVRDWRRSWPGEVLLVRGNHDRHAGDPPAEWGYRVESEPFPLGPFALRHYPTPTPGLYTLAGHLHPGVTLAGRGRQRLVLPCFHFTADVGTLPAFGGFTGTARVRPGPGDRVYAVAGDAVVAVGGAAP